MSAFPGKEALAGTGHQLAMANVPRVHPTLPESRPLQPEGWGSDPTSLGGDPHSSSQMPHSGRQDASHQMPIGQPLGSNLPDLSGLMYPSTNPFAYGIQPLSVLEDTHVIAPEQQSSLAGPANGFEGSERKNDPHKFSFEEFNNATFGNPTQQDMYQQHRQNPTSMVRGNHPGNLPIPPSTNVQEMGDFNMDDAFWQQTNKGRTGLTPGVNLDEIFGADGGWNPVFMDQGYGRTQQYR
jgi:hypothetical protein